MLWRCLPPYFSKDRTNIFLQNVGTCILFHLMSLFWSVLFRKTVNCHDYLALVTEKWMLPEHWWHHSDRELTCDWTQASVVRCQQLTTSAMALSTQSHNPKDHNTNLHLWEISKYSPRRVYESDLYVQTFHMVILKHAIEGIFMTT